MYLPGNFFNYFHLNFGDFKCLYHLFILFFFGKDNTSVLYKDKGILYILMLKFLKILPLMYLKPKN